MNIDKAVAEKLDAGGMLYAHLVAVSADTFLLRDAGGCSLIRLPDADHSGVHLRPFADGREVEP